MNLQGLVKNPSALVVAALSGSIALFSAGSVAGYLYAKSKLIAEYDERLEEEIERTRDYYKRRNKRDEFATPEGAAQTLGVESTPIAESIENEKRFDDAVEALRSYRGDADPNPEDIPVVQPIVVTQRNVFASSRSNPPIYEEIASRSPDSPYIISREEFEENDPKYSQVTLTWYEGDQTLADSRDAIVELVETTVGLNNLRFGHLSDDQNVVYIRNEQFNLEMEVLRSGGKYSEEVAGFVG